MIPDNVTLVVKAPNQQIEDQNIECQSSWSVQQLKRLLSEVYPNKPKTEEQKIIYSGQLLDDNIILKDVLRTYESQVVHIMHLVCTPTRKMPENKPIEEKNQPNSSEGLRRRNIETERPETTRPERQNDQNHTVEMQNYLSSLTNNYGTPPYMNYNIAANVPTDVSGQVNQMMMMQQAYLEYVRQYTNMLQTYSNQPAAPPPEAPPQQPEPQPDDEEANRDWLDHLYAASRLAILFSLVYVYGSPARFLLVALLVTAGYLHRIGFFRDLQVNGANNQQQQQPNANQQPAPQTDNPQAEQPAEANPQPNEAVDGNPQPTQAANANPQPEPSVDVNQQPERNEQSLLAATRIIFMSFFASLIPDTNY